MHEHEKTPRFRPRRFFSKHLSGSDIGLTPRPFTCREKGDENKEETALFWMFISNAGRAALQKVNMVMCDCVADNSRCCYINNSRCTSTNTPIKWDILETSVHRTLANAPTRQHTDRPWDASVKPYVASCSILAHDWMQCPVPSRPRQSVHSSYVMPRTRATRLVCISFINGNAYNAILECILLCHQQRPKPQ